MDHAHRAAITACYERTTPREERLPSGRINAQVTIGPTGAVKKVAIYGPPELAFASRCVTKEIKRWRFHGSGTEYEAAFPLSIRGHP
jgi:hypothetical protein